MKYEFKRDIPPLTLKSGQQKVKKLTVRNDVSFYFFGLYPDYRTLSIDQILEHHQAKAANITSLKEYKKWSQWFVSLVTFGLIDKRSVELSFDVLYKDENH